jgi:hypothetical protein
MADDTVAHLVSFVRRTIGDKGLVPTFTNAEIEESLKATVTAATDYRLEPMYGGAWEEAGQDGWRTFYVPEKYWGTDITFKDSRDQLLTPQTSDPLNGVWVFVPNIKDGVVRMTGKTYDVYATAMTLIDEWIALVKLDYSFSRGSRSYQRNQQIDGLLALKKTISGRRVIGVGEQYRSDIL